MRLARLRRFAWLLVLALSAGLAAPALASTLPTPVLAVTHVQPVGSAHSHDDGSVHSHDATASGQAAQADAAGRPEKVPFHCPGCVTAAECAVSCFGVGVLPLPFLLQAAAVVPAAWTPATFASPSGIGPFGDIDPPRPVSVR